MPNVGAERHHLTSYEAAYLALAIRLDAQMLTLDRQLALAAGERAVGIGGQRVSQRQGYEHQVTWPNYREASAYLAKLRAEATHSSPQTATSEQ